MKSLTRRAFLKSTLTTGAAVDLLQSAAFGQGSSNSSANNTIRIAVVGLGGIDVIGGVSGRGRRLMDTLGKVPDVRIAALCDVDQAILDHSVQEFKNRGQSVAAYTDVRKLLEDQTIDAVVIATPNHWHALATIWACQAGKDVYVEKPPSHNIWEGRQMVAAARKHGRIVQVGTQSRSSVLLREAFESLRGGQLGSVRFAHALVYRPRKSLGSVSSPTPVPSTVDYDLWCGPAPKGPLLRKQLHYEWHWFWPTGNGEIGNNGIHVIDICRWGLGRATSSERYDEAPPRVMSWGGRFAFNDCGQTANTQIAWFDYQPAPLICEVRNVCVGQGTDAAGKFRSRNGGIVIDCENGWLTLNESTGRRRTDGGIVIDCEGGYLAGDASGLTLFDRQGAKIKDLAPSPAFDLEVAHMTSFLSAVRSRKRAELTAEALEGHRSASCCHLANISYRLGQQARPEAVQERVHGNPELLDAFERCREHLRANGVNLGATPSALGSWLTFDPLQEQFVGELAEQADPLLRREYREPFVVPKV
jgi:predicted dehydrogenase